MFGVFCTSILVGKWNVNVEMVAFPSEYLCVDADSCKWGLLGLEWIDDDENKCPKCVNKHKTSKEREGERDFVYTLCYINTGLKATTIHNVTCQLYTQLSG